MFGKEKYSLEAYKQAEVEAQRGKEQEEKEKVFHKEAGHSVYIIHNSDPAVARLKKMYELGEKEAFELNKEYEELQRRAAEAIKSLSDFERDKLGMHNDLEEERENRTIENLPN